MPPVRAGRHITHFNVLPKGSACTTCTFCGLSVGAPGPSSRAISTFCLVAVLNPAVLPSLHTSVGRTRRVRCDAVKPQCGACARTSRHKGRGVNPSPARECAFPSTSSGNKDRDTQESQAENSGQADEEDSLAITTGGCALKAHRAALGGGIPGNVQVPRPPDSAATSTQPYNECSHSPDSNSSLDLSPSDSRLSLSISASTASSPDSYSPYSFDLPEFGLHGSTVIAEPYLGLEETSPKFRRLPDYTLSTAYSPITLTPVNTKRPSFGTEFPFPISPGPLASSALELPFYAPSFPTYIDVQQSSFRPVDFAAELRQAQLEPQPCSKPNLNWAVELAVDDSILTKYLPPEQALAPSGLVGARQFSLPELEYGWSDSEESGTGSLASYDEEGTRYTR